MLNQDIGQGEGVYISTYGCQMNVNDTERMLSLLEMVNFVPVQTPEQASLIIINSCSVREKPVHKVHSEVGRYREMKLKNPRLRIGVAGCVAQQEKANLLKDMPILDFVCGTDAIDQLPELVARTYQEKKERVVSARFEHEKAYSVDTLIRNPGVATFVNNRKRLRQFLYVLRCSLHSRKRAQPNSKRARKRHPSFNRSRSQRSHSPRSKREQL